MERLQKLWIDATNTCGAAPSRVLQEIRALEKELEELEENSNSATRISNAGPASDLAG